jgi:hypothetical protein
MYHTNLSYPRIRSAHISVLFVLYRALALTVEELRALLSVVLGVANLALLFLNRWALQ